MARQPNPSRHPYFPALDPERRWLYQLELAMPSSFSISPTLPTTGGTISSGITQSTTGSTILRLNAQTVTVPTVTVEVITIPHLNQDVKVAGRPSLGDMSVTFLSSYNLDSVSILEAWIHLIYQMSSETLNVASAYKADGNLVIYKPDFEEFKRYTIQGCWPSSIGDKDYDWSASDSVTRSVTFHVDKVLDPVDRF